MSTRALDCSNENYKTIFKKKKINYIANSV